MKVENLLVAGRCASMTHMGQSAARVSGGCLVMGQAAGTAAALAHQTGVRPRDVDVPALQARLEADGAYLGRDLACAWVRTAGVAQRQPSTSWPRRSMHSLTYSS